MNASPDDTAAAILATDRARNALLTSRQYRAQAEAVMEQDDPDDLAGDIRRSVYRHLTACADEYEALADSYRERAYSAQQIRRHRYDSEQAQEARPRPVPNTFGGRSYDIPRCEHGCCPSAVCEFVNDCAFHAGGAA